MTKDKRYATVKKLISGGYIKTFNEVLDTIPKTALALDMKIGPARFNKLIDNPESFTLKDIFKIASLIEVDDKIIIDLIYNQYLADKKSKKKSR